MNIHEAALCKMCLLTGGLTQLLWVNTYPALAKVSLRSLLSIILVLFWSMIVNACKQRTLTEVTRGGSTAPYSRSEKTGVHMYCTHA